MAGDLPAESPTPPDVDSLPPTEYLALETLAARHRLGERTWTFPAQPRIVAAVHALARRGLVDVKSGTAPKTILAWLTEAGRAAALRDDYESPILRMIEASSLGTPEAKALRASVSDEVAKKIVARSKELAGRGDLPEGQQSTALAALVAQVMHKALDDVDEGWHLSCLEPDADEGSGSCFKGHAARRMLEEDVAPKVVDALAARVRADVAEEIARSLDAHAVALAPPDDWGVSTSDTVWADALRWAARHARCPRCPAGICSEHHPAPAESVVGAPTPISAPSDVAAPRDALTDQDFADLRADARSARDDGAGLERAARALRAKLGTVDAFEDPVKAAAERQVARDLAKIAIDAYRALPEDEGTRDARYADETVRFAQSRILMLCGEGKEENGAEIAARLILNGLARRGLLRPPADTAEGTRQEGLINVEE